MIQQCATYAHKEQVGLYNNSRDVDSNGYSGYNCNHYCTTVLIESQCDWVPA